MDQVSSKVIHDINGNKKLLSYNPIQNRIISQTIREEEEYLEHLGTIIQRDFFPDLLTIKDESDPSINGDNILNETKLNTESRNPEKSNPSDMSLDKYLANNTTEDDASFNELIDEYERKERIKLLPFFPVNKEESVSNAITDGKTLALPGTSQLVVGPRLTIIGNNSVHFNPDGASQTEQELMEHIRNDRKIVQTNTRFKRPLLMNMDRKRSIKQLLTTKYGHVSLDGTESPLNYGTPQACGGYKFLDISPSPLFSTITQSPLMTWGELDATPSRLDESGLTPSVMSGSQAFRIPSPSQREQLAHQLADKASRQRIRNRSEAVKRVQSGTSSPSLTMLSPAARRLLVSSSYITGGDFLSRPSTGSNSSSGSPFVKSNTPRRLPSDLGVLVRRPSSGRANSEDLIKRDLDELEVILVE